MTTTLKRDQPMTQSERRRVVKIYFLSLGLVLLAGVIEQVFGMWNGLSSNENMSVWKALSSASSVLLPFAVGAGLYLWCFTQFMGSRMEVPRDDDLSRLDERQQQRLFQANFQAHRIYRRLGPLLTFGVLLAGVQNYSWFFSLIAAAFVNNVVSLLPSAFYAWNEPDPLD